MHSIETSTGPRWLWSGFLIGLGVSACSPGPMTIDGGSFAGGAVAGGSAASAVAGGIAGGTAGGAVAGGIAGGASGGAVAGGSAGGPPMCATTPSPNDLAWLSTFASCQTAAPGAGFSVTFRLRNISREPVVIQTQPGIGCELPIALSSCTGVRAPRQLPCGASCGGGTICEFCRDELVTIPPGGHSDIGWDGRIRSPTCQCSTFALPAGTWRATLQFWLTDGGVQADGGPLSAGTTFTLGPDAGIVPIALTL